MPSPDILQLAVLNWFKQHGRKNLPWQNPITPYRVWISEIMLQQTQVVTVIDYFKRFTLVFPNVYKLATAEQDAVLAQWTGLGYYARARHLHRAAQIICQEYDRQLPCSLEGLMALPGIGRSTAGAILSLAMQKPTPILDGNVKRVLSRLHAVPGWPGTTKTAKELWSLATHYTPQDPQFIQHYTQAMMDIGATICTRSQPVCHQCPLSSHCLAYQNQQIAQFPYKKPRKNRPSKSIILLILRNKNNQTILLEKRPPTGIWGGLWSFPEYKDFSFSSSSIVYPDKDTISEWCQKHYAVTAVLTQYLNSFIHSFSHFDWIIHPVVVEVIPDKQLQIMNNSPTNIWYNPLKEHHKPIGFAAPIKKLLKQI